MNKEPYPIPGHRLRNKLHRGAQLLLAEVCTLQKNMGAGFAQASAGEAGLRVQALEEIKMDHEIQNLNLAPVSDTIPEDW